MWRLTTSLLFALPVCLLPPTSPAGGSRHGNPLPLPCGDWVVATPQILSDVDITLRGNLIVERGGSLDLRGVTLRMEGAFDGERSIEIRNGGELFAGISGLSGRRTEIRRGQQPGRYAFRSARGSKITLVGATIRDAGWDDAHPGLVIEGLGPSPATDVSLLDCDLYGNFVGLTLRGFSTAIVGSRFHDNEQAGLVVQGARVRLDAVEISGQPFGLILEDSAQAELSSPLVTGNGLGLLSRASDVDLGYGLFVKNGLHLRTEGASRTTIHDNVFVLGSEAIVTADDATPVLAHNDILENDFGLRNENHENRVQATENFWGAASGPSGRGPGNGDSVSDGVEFTPWCTESCTRSSGPSSEDR